MNSLNGFRVLSTVYKLLRYHRSYVKVIIKFLQCLEGNSLNGSNVLSTVYKNLKYHRSYLKVTHCENTLFLLLAYLYNEYGKIMYCISGVFFSGKVIDVGKLLMCLLVITADCTHFIQSNLHKCF